MQPLPSSDSRPPPLPALHTLSPDAGKGSDSKVISTRNTTTKEVGTLYEAVKSSSRHGLWAKVIQAADLIDEFNRACVGEGRFCGSCWGLRWAQGGMLQPPSHGCRPGPASHRHMAARGGGAPCPCGPAAAARTSIFPFPFLPPALKPAAGYSNESVTVFVPSNSAVRAAIADLKEFDSDVKT